MSNSFGARDSLTVGDEHYEIFRLDQVEGSARLPYSLKVLLENLLRNEDDTLVTADQVRAVAALATAAQPVLAIRVRSSPRSAKPSRRTTSPWRPCSAATATLRAASTPKRS